MEVIQDVIDCPICMRPIDFALFCTSCGTNFCRSCIKELKQTANDKCPYCKSNSTWPINKFYNNIAESIKVPCSDCGHMFILSTLREHSVKCEVDLFDCKYCKKITKKKHECIMVTCPMCEQDIEKIKIREHCDKYCPKYLITCKDCLAKFPYSVNHVCMNQKIICEWCSNYFPLKEIGDHRMECKQRIVICAWCKCQYMLNEIHNCKMADCYQCQGKVLTNNLAMHYKQCLAKNKYCKYCHYYFPDLDIHEKTCENINKMNVCNVCHIMTNDPNHGCIKCNICDKFHKETTEVHRKTCESMIIVCEFCGQNMTRKLLTSHMNKCPAKPTMCRQCGRYKINIHNKICNECQNISS